MRQAQLSKRCRVANRAGGARQRISLRARDRSNPAEASRPVRDTAALDQIFAVIRAGFGVDCSEYKPASFDRNLAHRMRSTGSSTLRDYVGLLLDDPNEVRLLYEEVLVHVTSFFRNPEVFEILANKTLPAILARKQADSPIRVWVAGCATGEEVYSLAILLLELLGDDARRVQIYGTDVSHTVIATARTGVYSDAALTRISEARREKYFVQARAGRRIRESVRDLCSFFQHDLGRDPPLCHIDLVSCRNVVMYFDPRVQRRLLAHFHHALDQPGFLLLGCSEHISGSSHLFSAVNDRARVFARKAGASAAQFGGGQEARPSEKHRDPFAEVPRPPGVGRYLDRVLLTRYVPPGVLINDRMQILEFRGQTGPYLELAPGRPSNNIMTMVRHGLRAPLLAAIHRARNEAAPARTGRVQVHHDGATATCDLVVAPLAGVPDVGERLYVVMFETVTPTPPSERAAKSRGLRSRPTRPLQDAEAEHAATKAYIHSLIVEHEQVTSALREANLDLASRNDELLTMNAELMRKREREEGS